MELSPASAGFPLFRACARRLLHPSRTLQWVRSNLERSRTPHTAWDQSQWGIFLADRYAQTPTSPPSRVSLSKVQRPSPSNLLRKGPSSRTTGTGPHRTMPPCSVPWGALNWHFKKHKFTKILIYILCDKSNIHDNNLLIKQLNN